MAQARASKAKTPDEAKVEEGYQLLRARNIAGIGKLLHSDVVFHVEGRNDYKGKRAVMAFLREFDGKVGGNRVRLVGVATDAGRVITSDRTTRDVRDEPVDHICADSFTVENGLITEGWICHVDAFS